MIVLVNIVMLSLLLCCCFLFSSECHFFIFCHKVLDRGQHPLLGQGLGQGPGPGPDLGLLLQKVSGLFL